MVRAVDALLGALGMAPELAVGHSAGAAIALRLALDTPRLAGGVVSLNGALAPFPGAAGHIFPALAQLLFLNPLAIQMFAWRAAQPGAVERLIQSTGSRIDQRGLRCYEALLRTTGHINGALAMMARWNLHPLRADLPRLSAPLTLVAAQGDRAVPPRVAHDTRALLPHATLITLPALGHLAHEEAPGRVAEIVRAAAGSLAGARV
jgi:magnesium chelatase accessory protein